MFVSYAQNFEDVMLWRALKNVERGFYIDLGAEDPEKLSVTKAFYDRGWSGINVEPVREAYERFCKERSRDINLNVAASDRDGEAPFFEMSSPGLSTLVPDIVAQHEATSLQMHPASVTTMTLRSICEKYAAPAIHFLKIDVEGAEKLALEGADFQKYRPWIVVIEATKPFTQIETHGEWQDLLLRHDYGEVYFDGLNRFYVASEKLGDLGAAFRCPPNWFDQFVLADQRRYENKEAALRKRLEAAEQNVELAAQELRSVYASRSWRLTAPLRAVIGLLRPRSGPAGLTGRGLSRRGAEAGAMAQPGGQTLIHSRQFRDHFRRDSHGLFVKTVDVLRSNVAIKWAAKALLRAIPGAHDWLSEQYIVAKTAPRGGLGGRATSLLGARARLNGQPVGQRHPVRVRAVHQFHSGSSYGDAITNSMFLVQRVIRDLGFESEIFVEHPDPRLAGRLHPVDFLPDEGNHILLVHHAMGFDLFEVIVALQAPKALVYHNITPPEFLEDFRVLKRYAQIGRDQLGKYRDVVYAALADSAYNAAELRMLGYANVAVCPLLIDVEALRAKWKAGARVRDARPYTVLFVGRVAPSKCQTELVRAFACFRSLYPGESVLVLVGRIDGGVSAYAEKLRATIAQLGLAADEVTLTGHVSDEELAGWYEKADLYVSLSDHEGFGVPLVEAMAAGIPILAHRAGAVPETLGAGGVLIATKEPRDVANAMLQIASDRELRERIAAGQRDALDRFCLEANVPRLVHTLVLGGVAPPPLSAEATAIKERLRFSFVGHFSGSYSLATVNRNAAIAMDAVAPGSVRIEPVEGGSMVDLSDVAGGIRPHLERLLARPESRGEPSVAVVNHYPVYAVQGGFDLKLAMVFWEESLLPDSTVAALCGNFDGVIAPSSFVEKALIDSGVSLPIRVITPPHNLQPFFDAARSRRNREGEPYTFLHVSSCFPRKGVDALLAAYGQAFRKSDPVRLVIKGFPNPHNSVQAQIDQFQARDQDAPAVMFVNRDLPDSELCVLYADADALVLPTRGEGLNLAAAEALAAGLALVVTRYGGQLDFCDDATCRFVNFDFSFSRSHLATPGSVWAEPDVAQLAAAMRQEYRDARARRPELETRRGNGQGRIAALGDGASWTEKTRTFAAEMLLYGAPDSRRTRVTWISTWAVPCGIAEYSKFLLDRFDRSRFSICILCDDRTATGAEIPERHVENAWELGLESPGSIERMVGAIVRSAPEVVVVQHQPGLLSTERFAALLADLHTRFFPIVVTLHNSEDIVRLEGSSRQPLLSALRRCARVLVHGLPDLNKLKAAGLIDNVALFPQGVLDWKGKEEGLRQLRREDGASSILIGCYGFLLPPKGLQQLLGAAKILLQEWPDLRLRLVNALYPIQESQSELQACRDLAMSLGIANRISWFTDFLPYERSLELLTECTLVVLPHRPTPESSSAAVRTALASGRLVVTTPAQIFDDVSACTVRAAGFESEDIANAIRALLSDENTMRRISIAQREWIASHDWGRLSGRLQGMVESLAVNNEFKRNKFRMDRLRPIFEAAAIAPVRLGSKAAQESVT